MDLTISTVIEATLAICEKKSAPKFTSSMVRKEIQRRDPYWRGMSAGLVSSKLQPQLNRLSQCVCIELVPSDRERNKPWTLKDRGRLLGLQSNPDLIHHFLGVSGAVLVRDESVPEVSNGIDPQDLGEELLDSSDELQDKLDDIDNRLTASIGNLERQIESIRVETGQAMNHIVQRLRHQEQVLAEFGEMLSSIRSHFRP